jgi:DNA-binding XRE family transcriptional regulator
MNLQVIKSTDGKDEYVLLPIKLYQQLEESLQEEYVLFHPADYVENPVALARIQAGLTQKEFAQAMHVSQASVSKLENQTKVTVKTLHKVKQVLKNFKA